LKLIIQRKKKFTNEVREMSLKVWERGSRKGQRGVKEKCDSGNGRVCLCASEWELVQQVSSLPDFSIDFRKCPFNFLFYGVKYSNIIIVLVLKIKKIKGSIILVFSIET
jgi:hypothetical protein